MVINQPRWERGKSLCAYCGVNIGTTADHVIPQSLFIVKDEQMITVPSCESCQKAKGHGERDLRNYCTLHIGSNQHEDLMEHAERMVQSNEATRAWLQRILATAEEVILVDENDLEVDRTFEIDFNTDRMMDALKFIIRGLYYVTRGEPLRSDSPVEVTIMPWSAFPELMQKLGKHRLGDPVIKGNLAAWFSPLNMETTDPQSTAWVLCVNDGVGFIGTTGLGAILERQRKEELAANTNNQPTTQPRRVRVPRRPEG